MSAAEVYSHQAINTNARGNGKTQIKRHATYATRVHKHRKPIRTLETHNAKTLNTYTAYLRTA